MLLLVLLLGGLCAGCVVLVFSNLRFCWIFDLWWLISCCFIVVVLGFFV